MTCLEYIKQWIENNGMGTAFSVHVDSNSQDISDWDIAPSGITLLKESITGEKQYQQNFTLYTNQHSFLDYDRIKNSNFLAEFGYKLNDIKGVAITEHEKDAIITKVSTSNTILYSVINDNVNDGITYQLQLNVIYQIKGDN